MGKKNEKRIEFLLGQLAINEYSIETIEEALASGDKKKKILKVVAAAADFSIVPSIEEVDAKIEKLREWMEEEIK